MSKKECILDETKRVEYHACTAARTIKLAKKVYPQFNYIGSSRKYYVNGILQSNPSNTLYRFFINWRLSLDNVKLSKPMVSLDEFED